MFEHTRLGLKMIFTGARDHIAAHLPINLASQITLGAKWYDTNGHFKYAEGAELELPTNKFGLPAFHGYGHDATGWTVLKHTQNEHGGDGYLMQAPNGEEQVHFKWNIENHFRPASSEKKASNDGVFPSPGSSY